jgi:hypothetical protein
MKRLSHAATAALAPYAEANGGTARLLPRLTAPLENGSWAPLLPRMEAARQQAAWYERLACQTAGDSLIRERALAQPFTLGPELDQAIAGVIDDTYHPDTRLLAELSKARLEQDGDHARFRDWGIRFGQNEELVDFAADALASVAIDPTNRPYDRFRSLMIMASTQYQRGHPSAFGFVSAAADTMHGLPLNARAERAQAYLMLADAYNTAYEWNRAQTIQHLSSLVTYPLTPNRPS